MQPLLQLQSIEKSYYINKSFFSSKKTRICALENVDLSFFAQDTLGLVGESGCGKTTLAKIVTGLISPDKGQIVFSPEIKNRHKDIQMVFQNPYQSLNPLFKVEEIVEEPLLFHSSFNKTQRQERVKELLGLVLIDPANIQRLPSQFSGGQRQRISLARALVVSPKLLVLDEPVSSLDVRIQAEILELLKQLKQRFSVSYLFITHNLFAAKNFSDRLAIMYLGCIVEQGPADDVFNDPLHPYTQLLIKSARKDISGVGESKLDRNEQGCRFYPRCNYAQARCAKEAPILEQKGQGRFAACHFSHSIFKGEKG